MGFSSASYRLTHALRCVGGNAYHNWLEKLIRGKTTENDHITRQSWAKDYRFQVTDSCKEMFDKLLQYGQQHKVVIAASWTEGRGDWNKPVAANNVRYQDNDLTLYWRMYDYDYIEPWMYGGIEDLDKVCSIYGTQGFESDYVGIIWGKDYIFDGQKFITGDFKRCFDDLYGLVTTSGWCEDALTLLQNRYRIFLTRGRLGTVVYCEDEITRKYLKSFVF